VYNLAIPEVSDKQLVVDALKEGLKIEKVKYPVESGTGVWRPASPRLQALRPGRGSGPITSAAKVYRSFHNSLMSKAPISS
jgi:hypothetical protein